MNLSNSFASTLVVEAKFKTTCMISGVVESLLQDNVAERAVIPAQVMLPVGALTCVGKVTLNKSPFLRGEDATIFISSVVVAPLTKLSGVISTLVKLFTAAIVTRTPLVTTSIS